MPLGTVSRVAPPSTCRLGRSRCTVSKISSGRSLAGSRGAHRPACPKRDFLTFLGTACNGLRREGKYMVSVGGCPRSCELRGACREQHQDLRDRCDCSGHR